VDVGWALRRASSGSVARVVASELTLLSLYCRHPAVRATIRDELASPVVGGEYQWEGEGHGELWEVLVYLDSEDGARAGAAGADDGQGPAAAEDEDEDEEGTDDDPDVVTAVAAPPAVGTGGSASGARWGPPALRALVSEMMSHGLVAPPLAAAVASVWQQTAAATAAAAAPDTAERDDEAAFVAGGGKSSSALRLDMQGARRVVTEHALRRWQTELLLAPGGDAAGATAATATDVGPAESTVSLTLAATEEGATDEATEPLLHSAPAAVAAIAGPAQSPAALPMATVWDALQTRIAAFAQRREEQLDKHVGAHARAVKGEERARRLLGTRLRADTGLGDAWADVDMEDSELLYWMGDTTSPADDAGATAGGDQVVAWGSGGSAGVKARAPRSYDFHFGPDDACVLEEGEYLDDRVRTCVQLLCRCSVWFGLVVSVSCV
jgi:hypothetical protein